MAKGFVIAITTVLILISMLLYVQNFEAKQSSDLSKIAKILAAEKVTHAWSDVKDDINKAFALMIEQENNSVSFIDQLPANSSISSFLHHYGLFIKNYYRTPDLDVKFLSPSGSEMDLGNIPPVVTIYPQNIQYYYPDWAKRELFITVPPANASSISQIFVTLNISNAYLNCKPVNPSASNDCEKFTPNKQCTQNTVNKLYFNLTISDYQGGFYRFQQNCFGIGGGGSGSVANIDIKNDTGAYFIKVEVGNLPQVLDIDLHNAAVLTNATLILNTSDFYISYLTQLETTAVNYDTDRVDRA
jgi:hypothetical protein